MRVRLLSILAILATALVSAGASRRPAVAAGVAAAITFAPPIEYAVRGEHLVKGDWDGDGHLDLTMATKEGLALLWGHGDGTFEQPVYFADYRNDVDLENVEIAAADVNNDGRLDLCFSIGHEFALIIRLNEGGRSFGPVSKSPYEHLARGMTMADFNEDGWIDAIIGHDRDREVSVMLNQGNGTFKVVRQIGTSMPQRMRSADFNGDGHWDWAVTNLFSPHQVSHFLGDGTGNFTAQPSTPVGSHTTGLQIGDFNNDSLIDMVNSNTFEHTAYFHLNTGNGFERYGPFSTDGYPNYMDVADFDLDGDLDVAFPCFSGDGSLSLLENRGTGGFINTSYATPGRNTRAAAAGDYNEDGRPDVALGELDRITILLNTTSVSVPPLPDLVAHWKGDGNTIDSVNGNAGSRIGVTYGGGVAGQAFEFDGDDDAIAVADLPVFRLERAVTVAAWIRPEALPTGSSRAAILVRGDNRPELNPFSVVLRPDGKVEFGISSLASHSKLVSSAVVGLGSWTHVAGVFDGKTGFLRLYINGQQVGQMSTSVRPVGPLLAGALPGIGIGNHPGRPTSDFNWPFEGSIDDVRLWGRPLTATEVETLADVQLPQPPAAPSNVVVTAVSSNSLRVTWKDNSANEGGFSIERKLGTAAFAEVRRTAANTVSFDDTGLAADTAYSYRVLAFNSGGNSAYSNTASGRTLKVSDPQPPAAPSDAAVAVVSSTSLRVTWNDNSTDENGFSVERKHGTAAFAEVKQTAANIQTWDDDGLAPNTAYSYRVRAFNTVGNSAYSNTASGTTLPPALTAPANLEANSFNQTRIALFWDDTSDGEDGFKVERSTNGTTFTQVKLVPANAVEVEDTGLTANTRYWYRIRAYRGTDHSTYSNIADARTPPNPPIAPAGLTVEVVSATTLTVRWQDRSDNETRFRLERRVGNGDFAEVASVAANVVEWTGSSHAANQTYAFRVRAQNAGGFSAYSNIASALTPPATPTGLTVTVPPAPAGRSQLDLSWADRSGAPSKTKVERSDDGGATFTLKTTTNAGVVTYRDSGLTPNTRYVYRVRATNATGDSGNSAAASGTTLKDLPPPLEAPDQLTCAILSQTTVRLDWRDRSEGETGFKVERAKGTGAFAQITTVKDNVVTCTDTPLLPATAYRYRVRAYRGTENSAYTNEAGGTTLPNPPAAPAGLTATVVGVEKILLQWQDRSADEDRFIIERAIGDSGALAELTRPAKNVVRYEDAAIQPATVYRYQIRAENSGGASANSAIARAVVDRKLAGILEVARTLDFGKVKAKKSKTMPLVIRNTSTSERLRVVVSNAGKPFAITSGTGTHTLEPGASITMQVSFRPKKAKRFTEALPLLSTDPKADSISIELKGAGK